MQPEGNGPPERLALLDKVVAEYLKTADRGLAPDREAWLTRYPDLAEELAQIFAGFDFIEDLAGPLRTAAGLSPCPASTGPEDSTPKPTECPTIESSLAGEFRSFGDFEILGVLGVGGMGVVYRARQISLNRPVALKMIRSGAWAAEAEAVRFRNEAEAVAGLEHPNIVAVHELGRTEGQLYYTMRLIEGQSLAEDLSRWRSEPRRSARVIATVARAVHHAHQRGVLHRDLKPSNILVDRDGVPYVTDFGLAKRLGGLSLTQTGAVVGTPGYMAPEQTGSEHGPVRVTSDVYSLGAVLYALLAGRPPFRGENVLEVLEQTRQREPEPLSADNSRVDRDLETITRKCLEKDPGRRYRSAQALAEDLERWLQGKPIEARRPTRARRLWLWSRRHPSLAMLSAAVAVLVPSLIATLAMAVVVVGGERDQARSQREKMRENLYAADMGLAHRAWLQGDMTQLSKLLEQWRPQPPMSDLRDFAWHFLDSLRESESRLLPTRDKVHKGAIYRLAYSPDGRTLASASKDGTVRLKTVGREPMFLRRHTDEVNWVAFDRQGRRLATASDDGTARVWDVASGQELLCVTIPDKEIVAVEFTLDGQTLLTGDGPRVTGEKGDGAIRFWDLPSGAPSRRFNSLRMPGRIESLAIAPDGTSIATVAKQTELAVWNMTGSRQLEAAVGGEGSCVAYAPDGHRLAVGDRNGNFRLFRIVDGSREGAFLLEGVGTVEAAAFSPDGWTLATCGRGGLVRLWDLRSRLPLRKLDGEDVHMWCVTFSPNGRTLLTGGDDGVIRSWDLSSTQIPQYLPAPAGDCPWLAFTPDGAGLAVANSSGVVSFWDPRSLQGREVLSPLNSRYHGPKRFNFGADGKVLGLLTTEKISVWEPQTTAW
jgi:WD40 repeat protein